MKAKIVAIGNSKGVRIPKAVLRQPRFAPSRPVQLRVRERAIVIGQAPHPRAGWEESFKKKRPRKPEKLWGNLPIDEGWDK
ncbi:MAG: AbrB/MazE/SpoVT family DNA-binding domain-containing protein [Betaproteobacteria bacterium]|nr:AbrB/MazE/SpoVT family DNA-binding domain-containing protein [Betaproteobacteria bacterium]